MRARCTSRTRCRIARFVVRVEVDEHVAQEHDVEDGQRRERRARLIRCGADHRPELAGRPATASPTAAEVPDQHRRGQPAVDLELAVAPGPGPVDHLLRRGRVARMSTVRGRRQCVGQHHRDGVGSCPLEQAADQTLSRRVRRLRRPAAGITAVRSASNGLAVAEPGGLVGGERLDDRPVRCLGRSGACS